MRKTTGIGILVMALMLLSAAAAVSLVSAQAPEEPFIHVRWQTANSVEPFEHQDENSQWIFGPQPTITIKYADNDTDIADNDYYVKVGTDLWINITIPVQFLGEGNTLDSVLFWGTGHIPRSPIFVLQYNATADEWNRLCFRYEAGSQEPQPSDFLSLNTTASQYGEGGGVYVIMFAVRFEIDVGPMIFWTGMQATDTEGRPVSLSWLARIQRGEFESPPIGLDKRVERRLFGFPRYFYAEITDVAGDLLHYVGANDTFVFRVRANEPFGLVRVPICPFTFEEQYLINNPVQIPDDINSFSTTWTTANLSFPFINLVYNSTGAYALAGYVTNVTWQWSIVYHVWVLSFDMMYDESIDISPYFALEKTEILHDGAEVAWYAHFTNRTDMNPDPHDVGGTITADPYFWRVLNQDAEVLQARPEITLHNTVRLAFDKHFIYGNVKKDGVVVHRALQGDTLNVTLDIYGPGGKVNGSYYVFVNQSHAFEDQHGNPIDLDGYWVHIIRDNFTIIVEGGGNGNNETHFWHSQISHTVTVDLRNDVAYSNSTVTTFYYDADRNYVGMTTETSSSMITVLDYGLSVGDELSTFFVTLRFESTAPSMKVDRTRVTTGYRLFYQANVSQSGSGVWVLWPPLNWSQAYYAVDEIQGDILWTPQQFIVGDVRFWEQPKWTVTDEGALDLDGNIFTTEDQYFVKRTATWHDWGNVTVNGMAVGVDFEPSPGVPGDEFHSVSWMGVLKLVIEFEAAENFYWFHAGDFSPVNATEMAQIQETLWADMDNDIPQPGYEWIAWLSKNRTLDLSEIAGIEGNSWETTWFAWGTQQWFQVATSATSTTWAAFRAQYAGLLLFKDSPTGASPSAPDFSIEDGKVVTDEVTHVVLIDAVGSVELRQPFGATNGTGDVKVSPDTEVTFGISIYDVNVTLFPLQVSNADGIRSPWDLRQSYEGSLGLDPTDFDSWITHGHVEEMSFDIHFNVNMVNYDPDDPTTWNHAVAFKVDQRFGKWTLDEFNNTVLEGYGLAVNFFGVLGTATRTVYRAGERPVTDPNSDSVNASYYEFGSEDTPFANVSMGGLPYTWGGDNFTNVYTSGSSTAPIGAFSLIYESDNGETITDWNVEASMLFMTAGYDHWGGEEIICDPVFVSYSSSLGSASTTTTTTTTPTTTTTTTTTVPTTTTTPSGTTPRLTVGSYVLVGGVVAVIVIVLVLRRRRG